uniref:Pyridoxamine 5'-phosphate oxidase putative domain-containing protein n=1 Tax=Rhodotorula toruloides TaxID=5286 RepID=A0A0K3CQZ6_RHOTO
MGAFYDQIPESLIPWIKEQKVFWVASAPLSAAGTVNVSPKGYDCLTIASTTAVWYVDMTGSGNETISHMREPGNGRLTILFNAFEGPPRILRLFGHASILPRDSAQFNALLPPGDKRRLPGVRAVVWMEVERVGTSCGYAVPFMEFVGERCISIERPLHPLRTLRRILPLHPPPPSPSSSPTQTVAPPSENPKGLAAYWKLKNAESVDGLPGLEAAGFPPEKGAIRKARRGVRVAYGAEAVRRERRGWNGSVVFVWAVVGVVVGWWAGQGGYERVREELVDLAQQVAGAIGSSVA